MQPSPVVASRLATRALAAAVGLTLAASGLVVGAGAASAAPEDADLTGVVLDARGAPLADIGVSAYAVDPRDGSADFPGELDRAVTGPDGRYTFAGLDADSLAAAGKPVVSQFKLQFDDATDYPNSLAGYQALRYQSTFLGSESSKRSSTVTVPAGATGPVAAPTQVVAQYGGIRVQLVGPGGAPVTSGTALLFDGDDLPVLTIGTDLDDVLYDDPATPAVEPAPLDGVVTFPNQVGGRSYKILGAGSRTDAVTNVTTSYLGVFAGGTNSLASAARIPVAPGAYTTVTISLVDGLTSVSAPRVIGDAGYGSVLRADPGTWSRMSGTEYTYQWLRGSSVVGTGPTYVVSKADKKAGLRVLVVAYYGDFVGAAVSAPTGRVGERATVRARKADGAYAVTVRLADKKLARRRGAPTGKVVLLDATGAAASRAVRLADGTATLTPRRATSAPYTVSYLGAKKVGPASAPVRGGKGGKGTGGKKKGKGGGKGKDKGGAE